MSFGEIMKYTNFKLARIHAGMTQRQLAERAQLTERQITLIETGRLKPEAELRARLSEILKQPSYELFGGAA